MVGEIGYGWEGGEFTLATPPLIVSFSSVNRNNSQTWGSMKASRIWYHFMDLLSIPYSFLLV